MTETDTNRNISYIRRLWHKRLLRICIYLPVSFALLLFLLPIGTKYYLEQWLLDNGADEVVVQKVHFNLFAGTASLQGVNTRQEGRTVFSNSNIDLNISMQALLRREALIQKASLENVTLDIEQYENGRLRIGSYTIEPGEESTPQVQESLEEKAPWIFRTTQLDLSNITVHYKQPNLEVELVVGKGHLEKFNTDPADEHGALTINGTLNDAPLSLDLTTLRVVPQIVIDGSVSISNLQLSDLSELLQDVINPIAGTLGTKGQINFKMVSGKEINAVYEGSLELVTGNIGATAYNIKGGKIGWEGTSHFEQYANNDMAIDVDGTLQGTALTLDLPEQKMHLQEDSLVFKSKTSISIDPEISVKVHEGQITLNGIDLTSPPYKLQGKDISWKGLALYATEGQQVKVNGSLALSDLHFESSAKGKPLVTLGALHVDDLSWSNTKGLFCDKINIDSLFAELLREKQPEVDKGIQEKTKPNAASVPLIRVKHIDMDGDSGFAFTDNTLSTSFRTSLAITSLQVNDIDSTQPDKPLTYLLEGTFDKNAPLEIKGSALLFTENLFVEQNTELRNYSLQHLSPYVVDAIGTTLDAGQFNLISKLKIDGDTLDSKNNVVFKNIEARAVDEELQQKLNNQLPIPLDFALSMLRDKSGNIDLDVPVDGPLSELDIGISDVLITATSKAIVVAVTPYLAYTVLGPTGALVYLGLKAGEAIMNTNLPELEYEHRVSELSKEQEKTLSSVGEVIEGDKEQDYTICAKIFLWELAGDIERTLENQQKILNDETMRKQLRTLGEKRSDVVKEHLLSNFDIDKERLLICDPGVNLNKDGVGIIHFLK